MNRSRKVMCGVVSVLSLFALPGAFAQGRSLPGVHKIVRVTVLADRAEVVRRVTATVPKGETIVVIEGLPPELDERTLRVEAEAELKIQGLSSDIVKRRSAPKVERLPLVKKLGDYKKRINAIEPSVLGLRRKVGLARSYRTRTLEAIGLQAILPTQQLPKGKLDLDSWGKALELLSKQELQALKKIRDLEVERFRLKQDVKALELQLADHASPILEEVRRVHVGLSSVAGGQVAFDLIYRIAGPTWRVRYDMRYDSKRNILQIEGYGMVLQNTGEDWTDVALVLSNRMPVSGLRAPKIMPLILEGRNRETVVDELASYSEEISAAMIPASAIEEVETVDDPEEGVVGPAPLPKAAAADWKERPGLEDFVKLESSLTGQEFRVLQKQSLVSGHEPRQVAIFKAEVQATLVLESVPSISGTVYRRVTAMNSAKHSLLAGRAALHFNGNLMGLTSTATIAPGGRLELSFGSVSELNVTMEGVDQKKGQTPGKLNTVDGVKVYSFGRRFTLFNQSKDEAKVRILDVIPVSEIKTIKVSVDQKLTSKHTRVRPGILSFMVQSKAGKSDSALLHYKIVMP